MSDGQQLLADADTTQRCKTSAIGRGRHRPGPARDFSYSTRLLDVLEVLLRDEFVFVRAHDKRVYGIVTTADVVRVYDSTATPFFLIGELDQELRRLIFGDHLDEIRKSATRLCTSTPIRYQPAMSTVCETFLQ